MKKLSFGLGLSALIFGLALTKSVAAQKKYVWNGDWTITSRYWPANLKITPVSATKFRFKLNAMNGANMGDISGIAVIKGNKATFDDRKSGKKAEDQYGCRLTFTNKGSMVTITQTEECQSYAGLNVGFDGDYLKGKQRAFTENFVNRDVFPTAELDRKFKLLTKKDYDHILNDFHQIYPGEDLDALGATVFSACIEGICPWAASIIMFDKQGHLWAASINADQDKKPIVRYYTTAAGWTNKLPKTIEAWVEDERKNNEGLVIVYMNK